MRKRSFLIWIVAIVVLLAAAYTIYAKNKPITAQGQSTQGKSVQTQAGSQKTDGSQQQSVDSQNGQQASETGSPTKEQKVMAPDFTLTDMDGKTVKLSDYRGKTVILNFWAVWCKYCKQEMPDLNELNSELEKDKDSNTVIIAVDSQESRDVVAGYLKDNKISIHVLLDSNGAVTQAYGISGFPTTFVLNPDGTLYTYIPGATDKKTLSNILDKLKKGEPINK